MKREYTEGPKALEKFEKMMQALFRAPKTEAANRPKRKKKKADKG
jgi:hypothetical protein